MTNATNPEALKAFVGSPARDFVLHREPMLLLDTLLDIDLDFARCDWQPGPSPFDDADGRIPIYVGIETMAQCIAVHGGACAKTKGLGPPLGFLLGTRHFKSSISHFERSRTYVAECRELVRDSQGMGSFACDILLDGASVASANLAVFETTENWEPGE